MKTIKDWLTCIERRCALLQWEVGVLIAVLIALALPSLWLLLQIAAKVGAI